MDKQALIEKLLYEKAEKDNRIDIDAYALGLDDMYEALVLYGIIPQSEQLFCENCDEVEVNELGDWCDKCLNMK